MQKYKEYVKKMLDENKDIFSEFTQIYALYENDEAKYQDKFNKEGIKVQDIVREYEDRLCRHTEKGMYNMFSPKLAEKFQEEVKKYFPLIDHIGLKSDYTPRGMTQNKQDNTLFSIKKISLK